MVVGGEMNGSRQRRRVVHVAQGHAPRSIAATGSSSAISSQRVMMRSTRRKVDRKADRSATLPGVRGYAPGRNRVLETDPEFEVHAIEP
jgi:hypothetical protein